MGINELPYLISLLKMENEKLEEKVKDSKTCPDCHGPLGEHSRLDREDSGPGVWMIYDSYCENGCGYSASSPPIWEV